MQTTDTLKKASSYSGCLGGLLGPDQCPCGLIRVALTSAGDLLKITRMGWMGKIKTILRDQSCYRYKLFNPITDIVDGSDCFRWKVRLTSGIKPNSGEALEAPNSGGTMIVVLPSHFPVTSVSLPKDFGVSFQNKKDSILFTDCT